MTDPLGENSKNSAKKQEKGFFAESNLIKYNSNKHNISALYKRVNKHNEIELTKNIMDLSNRK